MGSTLRRLYVAVYSTITIYEMIFGNPGIIRPGKSDNDLGGNLQRYLFALNRVFSFPGCILQ